MSSAAILHTTGTLRHIEQQAAARLGDPFELMRRAGHAAWQTLLQHWPAAQSLLVVCGPGNNGGDGYVLATLAHGCGRHVRVFCLPGHEPRTPPARQAREQFLAAGGEILDPGFPLPPAHVLVDALFGIGLRRDPEGSEARLVRAINDHAAPVLALDVPSGVFADTGAAGPVAVCADVTLEFIAAKAGLRTGAARDLVGLLQSTDLSLANEELLATSDGIGWLRAPDLHRWLQPRRRDSHKGVNGRLLCVGGDHGHGGAIMLAAEAALRSGAGLVDVVTRQAHVAALLARLPESMVHGDGVEVTGVATLGAQATAIAVGPGLGRSDWATGLLTAAVAAGRPLVVDADGLNLIATGQIAVPPDTILTPHPGEAARLLQTDTASVQADRFSAVRQLADRYRAVVVLKGAGTLIADPDGAIALIDAGNPGMAVGGMGDVLAGVIGALLAQGLAPLAAAHAGALLHSVAADSAAVDGGERGLLPSDLMPWLRRHANPGAA